MTPATRHRLLDGTLGVAIGALWYTGGLAYLSTFDPYYMATGILAVGLVFYVLAHITHVHTSIGIETLITLGLFGTVAGFMMLVGGGTQAEFASKLTAAATAFSTTLAGLTAALLLRWQAHVQGER